MSTLLHCITPMSKAISACRILGTWIYNATMERPGVVHDTSIEQESGRTSSVLSGTGGLLHLQHRSYPLPWESLDYYSPQLGGCVLDLQRHELHGMLDGHALMGPFGYGNWSPESNQISRDFPDSPPQREDTAGSQCSLESAATSNAPTILASACQVKSA